MHLTNFIHRLAVCLIWQTKYAPQESTATETYFRRMADIEAKFYT